MQKFVSGIIIASVSLGGCANDTGTPNGVKAPEMVQTPAPVDIRKPQIAAPQLQASVAGPEITNLVTTYTLSTPPVGVRVGPPTREDVGIEGLRDTGSSIDIAAMPILSDKTKYLPAETLDSLAGLSRKYLQELQETRSVDKELRYEIWEPTIDLQSAFSEMKEIGPGERYEVLREIIIDRIGKINAVLRR